MTILLILLGSALALELLVHVAGFRRGLRRILAMVAVPAIGVSAGALLAFWPNIFSALLALIALYRMLNMIRVVQERMHQRYLRNTTRTTTLAFLTMQAVVGGAWWAWHTWRTEELTAWTALSLVQLAVAAILLRSLARTLRKTDWRAAETPLSDRELPAVTIAIPARNETEDLQRCLESIIASDYPKLEILVLDDCSQIKRTPEIIKQFAHDGVRFIQGHEPEDTWLPKNQAYARLTEEASGQYILFCGVDLRFERQSIRQLLTAMHSRHKQMMCILPRRQTSETYARLSLIQAMRYWWELTPPRRAFQRPPVISSCWIIERAALRSAGGFAAVSRSIVPEAHFARSVITTDGYSFLRSTDGLGISSNKQTADQRNTAIRMRYPQLHRRPEQVALLTFWELSLLFGPFALAIAGFWLEIGLAAHLLAGIAALLLVLTYMLTVVSTGVTSWWFGLVGQPAAVLTDIGLLHYSLYKYEFSQVEWKDRNICIPVMHVVSKLPDLR